MQKVLMRKDEKMGVVGCETRLTDSLGEKLYVGDMVVCISLAVADYTANAMVVNKDDGKFIYGIKNDWIDYNSGLLNASGVKENHEDWRVIKIKSFEELETERYYCDGFEVKYIGEVKLNCDDFDKVKKEIKQRLKQILEATALCGGGCKICKDCPVVENEELCNYIMNTNHEFIMGEDKSLEKTMEYILRG